MSGERLSVDAEYIERVGRVHVDGNAYEGAVTFYVAHDVHFRIGPKQVEALRDLLSAWLKERDGVQ